MAEKKCYYINKLLMFLVSYLFFKTFSHRLGRKYSTVVTFICALMCSIGITFSNTIITFMVLRSLTAVFYIGVAISTYTWGEIISPTLLSKINQIFFLLIMISRVGSN